MEKIEIFVESGKKRTFAGAIDWPGWCRSGPDEAGALAGLLAAAPRYAAALAPSGLDFPLPTDLAAFHVVERLPGDANTDFGVAAKVLSSDARPLDEAELARYQAMLKAFWQAFDAAAAAALGKTLRTGPRGGGRDLEKIIRHVNEADLAYLAPLGCKYRPPEAASPAEQVAQLRAQALSALAASARGEYPAFGPRGGARWTARYYVRRVAWHLLDHAWEIEDRSLAF